MIVLITTKHGKVEGELKSLNPNTVTLRVSKDEWDKARLGRHLLHRFDEFGVLVNVPRDRCQLSWPIAVELWGEGYAYGRGQGHKAGLRSGQDQVTVGVLELLQARGVLNSELEQEIKRVQSYSWMRRL